MKNQINYQKFDPNHPPKKEEKRAISEFLYNHLEEYGDALADIQKAMEYALGENEKPGGLIEVAYAEDAIVGAVVTNKTGMQGYIPENILVYIATHHDLRGKGIGKKLMENTIADTTGALALHVEPHNPAKRLYEKLGFTNKYLEMRLSK